ncbi:MAG: prepilin-type N-terminal cleavage/methylation domain-containing protein [Nitrospirae bacterium]|nr:prepilin-type N-terminal cleavage/methylation domain-containing protein [Nitrospirota bacterium]
MKAEYKNKNQKHKIPNFLSSFFHPSSFILLPSSSGFTLLEIMIALAIIGMTLVTVLHTVNYHAKVSYENIVATQMIQLAKEKLIDLEANPVNSNGAFEGTGFTFENVVLETEDPEILELKTVVKGQGKEFVLNELVLKANN